METRKEQLSVRAPNELAVQLSTKGAKCNLQFTTSEREYFERECGFTDEELEIFKLRARGKSVLQISFIMEELHGKETLAALTVSVRLRPRFEVSKRKY